MIASVSKFKVGDKIQRRYDKTDVSRHVHISGEILKFHSSEVIDGEILKFHSSEVIDGEKFVISQYEVKWNMAPNNKQYVSTWTREYIESNYVLYDSVDGIFARI